MWLIALVVAVVIILIVIIAVVAPRSSQDKDDRRDDGDIQVNGEERIPFFTPANDRAGMWGEKMVNYQLRSLLREDEYLLSNLLLPLKNGYKTELDCVLISHKGIFCIETKNWVGHISGNDEDEYWHQEYDDPYMADRDHKNPVKQNEGHCAILERKLHNNYQIDNVVIFANLEDGCGIESYYAFTIPSFMGYYHELNDDELNPSQIKAVYEMLRPFVATPEELKRHREEIRRRFK